ncbi:MAG: phosphate starvation-inducible protein PhoH [Flavobacteriaceae bacterium]|nr:phosphate starvation-inducible protein PhoH [Flavobacteriaceae bacterium]
MNELEINLKEINPQEFFGNQNKNLEKIKNHFPKLKIVARGLTIKAYGENKLLNKFQNKVNDLIIQLDKNNFLDDQLIENILKVKGKCDNIIIDKKLIIRGVSGKSIVANSPNQIKLVELIKKNDMVFAIGPAGTGKTYTGVAMAVRALKEKTVKRIILTRPAVEAGENLGYLPGDLKEKLDPFMQPLYDALRDMIPPEKLSSFLDKGIIEIAPLAFMRGRTLDNAFVILDEAQNTSNSQMKMFLTRMGMNAKFLINGDPGQIDLPKKVNSGLKEALRILKKINGIEIVYLDESDVIRNKIVKKILTAYKKNNT